MNHMATDHEPRSPLPSDSIERSIEAVRRFSRHVWIDLVRDDQSERWRRGNGASAETYFKLLPELRENAEDALVLVCGEVHLRRARGERASLGEYQQRFPEIADSLALQFELDEIIGYPSVATERLVTEPWGINLPGFEILQELGRGASGVVYLARQVSIDRLVAIKVIALSATDANRVGRQRQEAAILSRMQHPHVVQIHDMIEASGRLYSVIEYVDGPTLGEFADGKPLEPREAARLVAVLANALHTVHEAGILHRDLKPSNVLMTSLGEPKITDFGLAKLLTADNLLTTENCVLGTPSYMPPEQAAGDGHNPARQGDVYSLGAILYELLTGRPPFLGVTVLDTLSLIRDRDPVPPRTSQPRTPRDLETVCLKCLAKAPHERYPTAAALAADLERFLQGVPIFARRPAWYERAWRWCRRKPAVAALAACLLLTVLIGFAGIVWQRHQAEIARDSEIIAHREADDRAAELKVGYQRLRESLELVERGRVFSGWGRWDDSMNAVSEAITLRPDFGPAWEDRSRLYSQLGLWDLAMADARRAFELNQPAVTSQWWSYAALLAHAGDVEEYRDVCARMGRRFHGHGGGVTFDVARVCCILPDTPVGYKSFIERMRGEHQMLAKYPLPMYILGLTYYRTGEYQECLRLCTSSSQFDADWVERPLNFPVLALAYSRLGDTANARKYLELATESRDQWLQQLYQRGRSGWVTNKGATADWAVVPWVWLEFDLLYKEAARQLDGPPDQADPRWAVIRARAFAAIRRYEDADAEYRSANRLAPEDDDIRMEWHRAAAYGHVHSQDFAQAAIEFERATQLRPDDPGLWEMLAEAHLAAGNVEAYHRVCQELLVRFRDTKEPWVADRITRTCVNLPGGASQLAELLPLADVAALHPGSRRTQAALWVRTGQFEEAIREFRESAKHHAPTAWDWSFQAIAYHQLARKSDSQRCLANAASWIERADQRKLPDVDINLPAWGNWSWNEHLQSVRLFEEAKALVAEHHTAN